MTSVPEGTVAVGVGVDVTVGVAVGDDVGVAVGELVGEGVGEGVGVEVGTAVGVGGMGAFVDVGRGTTVAVGTGGAVEVGRGGSVGDGGGGVCVGKVVAVAVGEAVLQAARTAMLRPSIPTRMFRVTVKRSGEKISEVRDTMITRFGEGRTLAEAAALLGGGLPLREGRRGVLVVGEDERRRGVEDGARPAFDEKAPQLRVVSFAGLKVE